MARETDAGGGRTRALDGFLEARVAERFRVEVHEDTHAIVVQGRRFAREPASRQTPPFRR